MQPSSALASNTAKKGRTAHAPNACHRSLLQVPYKGPVSGTALDLLGGVRSACTYVGAGKLKELPKRTTFIRVSQQVNTTFGYATS